MCAKSSHQCNRSTHKKRLGANLVGSVALGTSGLEQLLSVFNRHYVCGLLSTKISKDLLLVSMRLVCLVLLDLGI